MKGIFGKNGVISLQSVLVYQFIFFQYAYHIECLAIFNEENCVAPLKTIVKSDRKKNFLFGKIVPRSLHGENPNQITEN